MRLSGPPLDPEIANLQQSVADDILASIERGEHRRWQCPWHGVAQLPMNAFTGRPFKSTNQVALWAAARRRGYKVHLWASETGWEGRGATVRAGEKGTQVLVPIRDEARAGARWRPGDRGIERKVGRLGGDAEGGELGAIRSFEPKPFFNLAQVDGAPPAADLARPPSPYEGAARLEELIGVWRRNGGPALAHGGISAHWNRSTDRITMPPKASFADRDGIPGAVLYSATLAHEAVGHATGSRRRLNRIMGGSRKSAAYAREELCAELAAATICAEHGFPTAMRDDHAAYISSWLSALKGDRRGDFFWAAAAAAKAVDFFKSAIAPRA